MSPSPIPTDGDQITVAAQIVAAPSPHHLFSEVS